MKPSTWRLQAARTSGIMAAAAVIMLTVGCASTTPVRSLLNEPQRYEGTTVRVEGRVTRSAGVLGVGAYEIDDGTGRIVVIAQGQGVPGQGAQTSARGTFRAVFSWLGTNIAAIVQGARR